MADIQHGTSLKMARRCETLFGNMCAKCQHVKNAYQREKREEHPEWNQNSNIRARQRRRAWAILSNKHPEEFESILQAVILRGE